MPGETILNGESKKRKVDLPSETEPVAEPKPCVDSDLTDYEMERLDRIERNKKMLASLGLQLSSKVRWPSS
jgi:hypothetical protein